VLPPTLICGTIYPAMRMSPMRSNDNLPIVALFERTLTFSRAFGAGLVADPLDQTDELI
jgi:hypothetical protein